MTAREVLGHIDCPCCGTAKGMRITPDRNGAPFGYCEANCNAQLRVGGDARRVSAFLALYPWASGKKPEPEAPPPTVTAPAPKAPEPPPAPKAKAEPFDVLGFMTGKKGNTA